MNRVLNLQPKYRRTTNEATNLFVIDGLIDGPKLERESIPYCNQTI